MDITAYDLAQRYVGIHEIAGTADHPLIQWWLSLCGFPTTVHDEVPWCSAFVNGIAWELRLPRSKSAAARSWLTVGTPMDLDNAEAHSDVVILSRGDNVTQGHVGFYAGRTGLEDAHDADVLILGGNQFDGVRIESFPLTRVLGIRRLA